MRRRLFMFGIFDPQNVARILYQSMLKAPSGADEGAPGLSRVADTFECTGHALIWTRGSAPERVVVTQTLLRRSLVEFWRWNPLDMRSRAQRLGRVLYGGVRRAVALI